MHASVWHSILTSASLSSPVTVASNEPIQPIPLELASGLNPERVSLGRMLVEDPFLSSDNALACASYHILEQAAIDPCGKFVGVNGIEQDLNVSAIFNRHFQFKQCRARQFDTGPKMVDELFLSRQGSGVNWSEVLEKCDQSFEYERVLSRLCPHQGIGMTQETVRDAIFTFEQSFYTPNSQFDRFLRGDPNALMNDAKQGYRRFNFYGCMSCHQGMLLEGRFFQKSGVFGDYARERGDEVPLDWGDLGRFNVTEKAFYFFKVPGLRNIQKTAPYFHDGAFETLEEAV